MLEEWLKHEGNMFWRYQICDMNDEKTAFRTVLIFMTNILKYNKTIFYENFCLL